MVKRQFMVAEALRPSWLRAWPSCLARQSVFGVSDASRPRYKITFRSEVPFVAVTDRFREPQYVDQFFEAPICPASAASGGDPVMLGAKIGVARRTADGSAIPSAPFSSDCPGE